MRDSINPAYTSSCRSTQSTPGRFARCHSQKTPAVFALLLAGRKKLRQVRVRRRGSGGAKRWTCSQNLNHRLWRCTGKSGKTFHDSRVAHLPGRTLPLGGSHGREASPPAKRRVPHASYVVAKPPAFFGSNPAIFGIPDNSRFGAQLRWSFWDSP